MNASFQLTLPRGHANQLLKSMDGNAATETQGGKKLRDTLRTLLKNKAARHITITAKGEAAKELFPIGLKYVCK